MTKTRVAQLYIAAMALLSTTLQAGDTSQANEAGKTFANDRNAVIQDAAKTVDPNAIPGFSGADVPAADLYSAGVAIEDLAKDEAATNPVAQDILAGRASRPEVNLQPESDPMFLRLDEITSKAHGLSETYTGCVDLPTGAPGSGEHVSLCGDSLVCPDGVCTAEYGQTYEPATADFQHAATGLAVAAEIGGQFDYDNLTIFTGEAKSCKKSIYDIVNCCASSGWDSDPDLASCSDEEKELGFARQTDRVHYVGSDCTEDAGFVCVTRKQVYCTFPSKLGRIILEQGKSQLGGNFGSDSHPNCSGLTVDELTALNFDAMDFSEFFTDVMAMAANGTTPDSEGVVSDIREKLHARYPQLQEAN